MSKRAGKHHYLIENDTRNSSDLELDTRLEQLLSEKMHGISFSAYGKGQKHGDQVTLDQVKHRMALLESRFNWVRSFSTTQGN